MSSFDYVRHLYLAYVSKPASDRKLYRAIRKYRFQSIVEIGMGTGLRAQRLIASAASIHGASAVRYSGIDLFEARPAGSESELSIKAAHKLLKSTGAQIRLVPGDVCTALARSANNLLATDLLVISSGQLPESLADGWFYVPRILGPRSLVFMEQAGETGGTGDLVSIATERVSQLASAARIGRRAA